MKCFITIILFFIASVLTAQQHSVISGVGEQRPKYYIGMTTDEAQSVSSHKYLNAKATIDSGDIPDRIVLIIDKILEPALFGDKLMKLELVFSFDSLLSAVLTLNNARQCELPFDATCIYDTSGDYHLTDYMTSLFNIHRHSYIPPGDSSTVFHITRMNRFTDIEMVDSEGHWHDIRQIHKRFIAWEPLRSIIESNNNILELPIELAPEEEGAIICSCGELLDTRWGAK